MTVNELIEWLKTQDQDRVVEVIKHESGRGYYDQGGIANVVIFDPSEHAETYSGGILLGVING